VNGRRRGAEAPHHLGRQTRDRIARWVARIDGDELGSGVPPLACSSARKAHGHPASNFGGSMTRIRSIVHPLIVVAIGLTAILAVTAPAGAITGGSEDTNNTYSNVGMLVFYQPDGRFRCSGTLIAWSATRATAIRTTAGTWVVTSGSTRR
jgi:hypothetical protein